MFWSSCNGMFQFHNGSIKGIFPVAHNHKDKQFQFHNGSIKGYTKSFSLLQVVIVSIPQWFD